MKTTFKILVGLILLAGVVAGGVLASRRWAEANAPKPEVTQPERAVVVDVVEARMETVRDWVFAEGIARSARREYLTFKQTGRVAWVKPGSDGGLLREGDLVQAGELLAYQDKRHAQAEVSSAQATVDEVQRGIRVAEADLAQARADSALAEITAQRYARLRASNSVSQQELDEHNARAKTAHVSITRAKERVDAAIASHAASLERLKQAKLGIEDAELRSPMAGMLAYVNVREGHLFMPSIVRTDSETSALRTVPLVVMSPNDIEVTIEVPAYERGRLAKGQTAYLDTGGYGPDAMTNDPSSLPIQGKIVSVNPAIDPSGRTFQVRINVKDTSGRLADGMFIAAWIAVEEREGVSVPSRVIQADGDRRFVYVAEPQTSRAVRREIVLGISDLDRVEVRDGLLAGEKVVSTGSHRVGDGTLLKVLPVRPSAATPQKESR